METRKLIFPVKLTTSRIINHTRLMPTLVKMITAHTHSLARWRGVIFEWFVLNLVQLYYVADPGNIIVRHAIKNWRSTAGTTGGRHMMRKAFALQDLVRAKPS